MGTLALVLAVCLAGPPLVVGLAALGTPWRLSTALIAAAGIVVVWRTAAQARAIGYHRLNWPVLVAAMTVLGAATVYTSRLSVFMIDETRVDLSVVPNRAFFRTHSCLSSYTEAARLAPAGVNIFDPAQYSDPAPPGEIKPRFIGSFEVDLYQYPPAFLALPRPAVAAGLDFLTIRRLWFAVQSVVLFMAVAFLARWIGGPSGLLALLLAPVLWLAVTTRLGLQIGNFQLTGFAMAVLAMIAFERGHAARGGFALGFPAISKVYPGVLGVLLLVDRRWSAVGWTLVWGVALTAAAWFMVGSVPFLDFFRYQLPRVASAQAFPWIENADAAAINYGVHGLVIKLRFLGVPWTGPVAASRAASLYGVLLLPLALASAWELRRLATGPMEAERLRLRTAQVWLGLLSLASFRSPFVPDAYALIGTLWLLTLIAAEGHWRGPGRIALVIGGAITMLVLDGGAIPVPVPTWIIAATLALQVAAFALNLAVVLTPGRSPTAARMPGRPSVAIEPASA